MTVEVEINELGGNCPVQATGIIEGYGFYFRARGSRWSVEIYTGKLGPWEYGEDYGTDYEAGWMDPKVAETMIYKAATIFHEKHNVSRETLKGEKHA